MWLPWQIAAWAAVALAAGLAATHRPALAWAAVSSRAAAEGVAPHHRRARRLLGTRDLLREVTVVLTLYAIWQFVHELAVTHTAGASRHATWIVHVERFWRLPSELAVQHQALTHPLVIQFLNAYYAIVHVPALGVFLVWLWFRHRERYPAVRNVLALTTAACLVLQTIPVDPPRFRPDLGYVDAGLLYGQSVYGRGGNGISNQLAAMPSVHVAWAVLIGLAAVLVGRSRWRWLVLLHPALTVWAVVATGNHWWLDGIVAAALLGAAAGLQSGVTFLAGRRSPRPTPPQVWNIAGVPSARSSEPEQPDTGGRTEVWSIAGLQATGSSEPA